MILEQKYTIEYFDGQKWWNCSFGLRKEGRSRESFVLDGETQEEIDYKLRATILGNVCNTEEIIKTKGIIPSWDDLIKQFEIQII